jgi:hypothetical protein
MEINSKFISQIETLTQNQTIIMFLFTKIKKKNKITKKKISKPLMDFS